MLYFLREKLWLLVILLAVMMSSCQDKESIYDRPEWLKGNAWEVLSSRGDMSLFLKAVERSGFKDLVEGKGLTTVLAPTDEAMQKYLQEKGYSSIDEMPLYEVKKLVGFHLVYYSFNKEQFANYQPDGLENSSAALAGTFFKHRTKSRDSVETVFDEIAGNYKDVIHKERFLPVFSSYLFSSKNINAKYNYEYFYPSSTWTGDNGGFNVSNASVLEYAIPTDNGYVHVINQVLEPLETIYNEIKKEPDYSLFLQIYDQFKTFNYDADASKQYAATGDSLYICENVALPEIASEWSYNGEVGKPDYSNLGALSSKAFNVFAPDNAALIGFFNDFWKDYYPAGSTLVDVDFLPIAYLMYNHVYTGSIVLPEEITKGIIKSSFGNIIQFNPASDVSNKKICSNGTFYGLNKVIVPPMFKSITAPILRDPGYKIFLYMLNKANMIQPLMSDAIQNTIFIPSNDVILSTIYQGNDLSWDEGNPKVFGDEGLTYINNEGIKTTLGLNPVESFVNNHIVTEKITEIAGKKVYRTRNPFSYIYVTDAGVASSSSYNTPEPFIHATEISGNWTNGKAYAVDASLIKEEGNFKNLIDGATSSTSPLKEFREFSILLKTAGLIGTNNELLFLYGDKFVVFAPSDAAINAARASIPTTTAALAAYLKRYFVPVSMNSLTDYPFIGSGIQGNLKTSDGVTQVNLTDNGSILKVSANGKTGTVLNEFPKIYADGAVYMIDSVL